MLNHKLLFGEETLFLDTVLKKLKKKRKVPHIVSEKIEGLDRIA